MSFVQYCLRTLRHQPRPERTPVRIACRYQIFTPQNKPATSASLNPGVIHNLGPRGLGILIQPPFSKLYEKTLRQEPYHIYVTWTHPTTRQTEGLLGEIRWIKSVFSVRIPYSEIGIFLTDVDTVSKEALLSAILHAQWVN